MGGAVALGLAVNRPEIVDERVAAFVLVNGTARGPPTVRCSCRGDRFRLEHHRPRRPPPAGRCAGRGVNFGVDARHSHVVAARAAGAMIPASRRPGFTRRLLGIDLSEGLADVGVPVLALTGSADRVLAVSNRNGSSTVCPTAAWRSSPGRGTSYPSSAAGLPSHRAFRRRPRALRLIAEPVAHRARILTRAPRCGPAEPPVVRHHPVANHLAVGRCTYRAHPSASKARIGELTYRTGRAVTHATRIGGRRGARCAMTRPCSQIDSTATLRLRSLVVNGRRPNI